MQVQQSSVVDMTMKVGQTATEVAVKDVTPMVQTDNATLGHTLERTRIEQLPINGRTLTIAVADRAGSGGHARLRAARFLFRDGAGRRGPGRPLLLEHRHRPPARPGFDPGVQG